MSQWFDTEMRLVTSREANQGQIAAAGREGAEIPEDVEAVPMATQIVAEFDIPLYADAEGNKRLPGAGVLLDEVLPSGTHSLKVYPVTDAAYYKKNMSVSCEWEMHRVWPQAITSMNFPERSSWPSTVQPILWVRIFSKCS